jgi:hypothetical protein
LYEPTARLRTVCVQSPPEFSDEVRKYNAEERSFVMVIVYNPVESFPDESTLYEEFRVPSAA